MGSIPLAVVGRSNSTIGRWQRGRTESDAEPSDPATSKLSETFGQQIIIHPWQGNTTPSVDAVARLPGGGYTLLFATNTTPSINSMLYSKLPYKPGKEFLPASIA